MTIKTKDEVQEWLEKQYRQDPGMRERVEAMLAEMRLQQDLVALRERRGLSQSDVAQLLGVSQPAIAKLESDRVMNAGIKTIARYVAACGGELKIGMVPLSGRSAKVIRFTKKKRIAAKR